MNFRRAIPFCCDRNENCPWKDLCLVGITLNRFHEDDGVDRNAKVLAGIFRPLACLVGALVGNRFRMIGGALFQPVLMLMHRIHGRESQRRSHFLLAGCIIDFCLRVQLTFGVDAGPDAPIG